MFSFRFPRMLATAALLGVAGCVRDAGPADTAGAGIGSGKGAGDAPALGAATDAGTNGLWTIGSLEKRLDLQGMAPRRLSTPVNHSFLSVPGTAYQLGNAELQVFIYDNANALARDVGGLDTLTVSPPDTPSHWPAKATLVTNANLAAILLSENALQIERVQRALMAGTGSTVFNPAARPR
jgi:hypothetical protein